MLNFIISRYEHDLTWLNDYEGEATIYDRSEKTVKNSIVVPNIGSDLYDKFTFIIDNYDNLPDVAIYTKANLFKYMSKEEFDLVKDNKTFTPLLTQYHRTYRNVDESPVCFYQDGLYWEINNYWYLHPRPAKYAREIIDFFRMYRRKYNGFAPGSNYILPKENILQHPKAVYEMLKSYLSWGVYPGDAMLMERNLYYLWSTTSSFSTTSTSYLI